MKWNTFETATRVPPLPDSVIRSLEFGRAPVRFVVVLYVLVHAILAFADPASRGHPLLTVISFVTVSIAAVVITLPAADPLPRDRSVVVLALCMVAGVSDFCYACVTNTAPFAHWHLGAIALVLVVLAVRGRPLLAWVGYAALVVLTLAWTLLQGLGIGQGVDLTLRHAGTLLAGTLFAVGLRRTAGSLLILHDVDTARASAQAQALAAMDEREAQLARVNGMARPLLERLVHADHIEDHERAEALQVEASLRDAMRGRSLSMEPVISSARAARARGVEVTLLDDSGGVPPLALGTVTEAVGRELDSLDAGRLTARLLPRGRRHVATIVIDDGSHSRMLRVAADGTVSGS